MYKFIVTKELGKLARWLRILGFDTSYYVSDSIGSLIIESLREDRIIVTKRRGKIDELKKVIVVNSNDVKMQLKEIMEKLDLVIDKDKMFMRCVLCNELLRKITKEEAKDKVPEYVFKIHTDFMTCIKCGRIYWQGSHWGNINNVLKDIADGRKKSIS